MAQEEMPQRQQVLMDLHELGHILAQQQIGSSESPASAALNDNDEQHAEVIAAVLRAWNTGV